MAKFIESLSEQGKINWAKLYEELKKKEWKPTKKAKDINLEVKEGK